MARRILLVLIFSLIPLSCGVAPKEQSELSKILTDIGEFGDVTAATANREMLIVNVTNSSVFDMASEGQANAAAKLASIAVENSDLPIKLILIAFYRNGPTPRPVGYSFEVKDEEVVPLGPVGSTPNKAMQPTAKRLCSLQRSSAGADLNCYAS